MPSDTFPADPNASWPDLAGGLASACGGVILGLEACVVVPGLLPAVAIGLLLVAPFAVAGMVAAVVIGVPVAVVRLALRAVRG
jgi:hypothetical protein